jgi:TetR/AcrR family transcriptional regulator
MPAWPGFWPVYINVYILVGVQTVTHLDTPPHRRDPGATRERILKAALAEFAASGFAGARVHAIAQRAGVNARMLYHYFGEKEDLFRAILRRRFAERPIQPETSAASLATQMGDWFERMVANPDWVRLTQWEALETADGPIVEEDERRMRWQAAVARIRAQQTAGRLVDDLDADLVLLAMVALTHFPVASPPVVRMVTGTSPGDPAFKRRYTAFLGRMSEYLAPPEPRIPA